MRVCRHYRIPHSLFLGRVVGPDEPLWSEDDQDKALRYEQHLDEQRAQQCPSCHTTRDEWLDPVTGQNLLEPAWEVAVVECPGCRRIADSERTLRESKDADGRRVILQSKGTAEAQAAQRAASSGVGHDDPTVAT
jgi:hypothetical protein